MRALAEALERNTALTRLGLGSNYIGGGDGLRAIAGALQRNTSLTTLCLESNNIGDDGVRALAGALERNATLTSLDLRISLAVPERLRLLVHGRKGAMSSSSCNCSHTGSTLPCWR